MNMKKEWKRKAYIAKKEIGLAEYTLGNLPIGSNEAIIMCEHIGKLKRRMFNFNLAANRVGE